MVLRFVKGGEVGVAQAPGIFEKIGVEVEPLQTARSVTIRSYRRADRQTIRQICCDTGFLGKPVDAIFQDRELFADPVYTSHRYRPCFAQACRISIFRQPLDRRRARLLRIV